MFSLLFKKSAINSCYIFSLIILIYAFFVTAFGGGVGINPVSVILLYPFSFATALAFGIVKHTSIRSGAKLALHFVIFTLALMLFVFLPHGGMVSPKSAFLLFVIYCVIYASVAAITAIVKGKNTRKDEKSTEYKNVY